MEPENYQGCSQDQQWQDQDKTKTVALKTKTKTKTKMLALLVNIYCHHHHYQPKTEKILFCFGGPSLLPITDTCMSLTNVSRPIEQLEPRLIHFFAKILPIKNYWYHTTLNRLLLILALISTCWSSPKTIKRTSLQEFAGTDIFTHPMSLLSPNLQ